MRASGVGSGPYWAGLDVGASKIVAAILDDRGRIAARTARHTRSPRRAPRLVSALATMLDGLRAQVRAPLSGIGVAFAAQVDSRRGIVRYAPNFGWRNVALGPLLRLRWRVPILLLNDVRAATYGEWKAGAGRNLSDFFCFFVGTGIGGGAVVDGHLLDGPTGGAAEVGHTTVVVGGRRCSCPNRGCLEAYAGGWAIAREARNWSRRDPVFQRELRAANRDHPISARTVFQAAENGSRKARRLLREPETALEAGIVSIVNSFNPRLVVIEGGVAGNWPGLASKLQRAARSRCQPPAARGVRVVKSHLGPLAPAIGAALRVRDEVGAQGSRSAGTHAAASRRARQSPRRAPDA